MTEHDDLGRSLARWLEADAIGPAPAGRFEQAIEATRGRSPRSGMLASLGSHWVESGLATDAPRVSWRSIAVIVLIALALAASTVFVGGQRRAIPAITVPAANGLIAYSFDGDIHVGDRVTGQTRAIVTGEAVDSQPRFSPDGSHVAFIRGDPWGGDASIIVVRADGSNERVAMPSGAKRGIDFTWTPNGASLLVNHDSEPSRTTGYYAGELSIVDASGEAEPRLLTPPLPIGPGGPYFRYTAQVAPMFRPPNGDLILSSGGPVSASLYVWDAALENRTRLIPEGDLAVFERPSFSPWDLWWSPDGSMIAFAMGWGDREPDEFGTFLMDADGSNARPLEGVGAPLAWSPDGSMIAYQRGCPDPGRQGAVIVILDVASGDERVLDATAVETKIEGTVPSPAAAAGECYGGWIVEGPDDRAWDYEGWSWSPDARSIVMLERSGTRPMVVDVETGQATELPWEADSAPSWQRIPPPDPG